MSKVELQKTNKIINRVKNISCRRPEVYTKTKSNLDLTFMDHVRTHDFSFLLSKKEIKLIIPPTQKSKNLWKETKGTCMSL